jgi:hypothetical protein
MAELVRRGGCVVLQAAIQGERLDTRHSGQALSRLQLWWQLCRLLDPLQAERLPLQN